MMNTHSNNLIYCACGCGIQMEEYNRWGNKRKFIHGHNSNIMKNLPTVLTGEKNPSWKGGMCKHSKGYLLIWKRDHPFADVRGYVPEHRLVMEKHLGRYLRKDEDVHHINGNKKDNRLENLQLLNHGEHSRLTNKKKRQIRCGCAHSTTMILVSNEEGDDDE